jgi:gluconate 2-dehydrogenase gamma chain
MDTQLTRREWMLAAACSGEVLSAQQAPAFFDPATAAEIEAIAAQIIPDDDTPGARQAGVIQFIDRALAGYDQDKQDA